MFPSEMNDCDAYFQAAVEGVRLEAGDEIARQTVQHIKSEFSTLDWILEGMLERNGLRVIRKDGSGFLTAYVCEK